MRWSEHKKEIGAAVAIAVILAAAVGYIAFSSFPGRGMTSPSSTCSRTTTEPQTSTTPTSGVTATETTTIQSATSTVPYAQTYTNETVSLDPCLVVTPMKGLLETSSNATAIAAALASSFNELPIRLTLHTPATCTDNSTNCREMDFPYSTAVDFYVFRSSTGSNITVELVQGKFLKLQYVVQNYNTLYNDYFNNYTTSSNPSPAVANATVGNLMLNTFGIDLSKVPLTNPDAGVRTLRAEWSEQYRGIGIANSGDVYFEYYPPTSQIIRLVIDENSIEAYDLCCGGSITLSTIGMFNAEQGGWYLIPPNFPLNITTSAALNAAKEYGTNTLHMSYIVYASIDLHVVQNHLYYAATISDQSRTYYLFVNPVTGDVGFPQS